MAENREYVPFGTLFSWGEKSTIKSGEGRASGKYRMFVCSDTEIKFYDEALLNCEALVFGTGGKASCHYVNEPFAYSTDCAVALPKFSDYCCKFYYYYFRQNCLEKLQRTFSGSGLQHTSKKKIEKILVPVLAKDKQERIVAKIEEHLSQLDDGINSLRMIQWKLLLYRQSVLKSALSGDQLKIKPICHKKIIEFAEVGTGATPLKTNKAYYGGNIPWVTSGKINDGKISTPSGYITEKAILETNCKIYPVHTLLVAMYGEGKTRGKCAELMIPAATNQALAAIEVDDNSIVTRDFLRLFLTYNYDEIRRKAVGGVQPNLNLNIIKNLIVPVYSVEQQENIVAEAEVKLSVLDSLEANVSSVLQKAEALQQSILRKAFNGE